MLDDLQLYIPQYLLDFCSVQPQSAEMNEERKLCCTLEKIYKL